jgi:hypothetical protein
MGIGDDIMATSLARAVTEAYPGAKAIFGDPETCHDPGANKLNVHWSPIFENNPHILAPGEAINDFVCVPDYPGHRVSIDYAACPTEDMDISTHDEPGKTLKKMLNLVWADGFRAPKGELFFTDNEKSAASEIALRLPRDFVVVEPKVAAKPWINHKGWPFSNWQKLVDGNPDIPWVQFTPEPGVDALDNVAQLITPDIRQALAILACAGGFVGTDGALHHAAAALNVPAVVLWGHYSSPEVFGYDEQTNIRMTTGPGCGSVWKECADCVKSMEDIRITDVDFAVQEMTNAKSYKASREGTERSVFRMVGAPAEGGQK